MSEEYNERRVSSIVDGKYSGYRIDSYLSEKFNYHSRNEWQNLIRKEIIILNSRTCKSSKIVKSGDIVEFIIDGYEEPECNMDYEIVYQDDYIIAVNKPYNCIIHPVGPFFKNTLSYRLEKDLNIPVYSVNRLDRETTGIVLFGKDSETARILSGYFVEKRIYKEYIVAIHGRFPEELSTKGYLLQDKHSTVRKKRKFQYEYPDSISETDFETSETDFELIKTGTIRDVLFRQFVAELSDKDEILYLIPNGEQLISKRRLQPDVKKKRQVICKKLFSCTNDISLLKVMLKTGRQHQIRATLCSLGYPVVGDKLYGVDDTIYLRFIERKLNSLDKTKLIIDHQALHAKKIIFTHPYSKVDITITAEVPKEILYLI